VFIIDFCSFSLLRRFNTSRGIEDKARIRIILGYMGLYLLPAICRCFLNVKSVFPLLAEIDMKEPLYRENQGYPLRNFPVTTYDLLCYIL
jgi:hypothetical protein